MSGAWVSTSAGSHLKGRKSRNTAPELALRSAVHRLGLRFRLHRIVSPRCTPDFVLPGRLVAVFVDGCFWHGCPEHGVPTFKGPNADRWTQKIEVNRARDHRNTKAAQAAGWTVVRIWECEIRRDVDSAARRVAVAAQRTDPSDG